jgi:hypothetical protein
MSLEWWVCPSFGWPSGNDVLMSSEDDRFEFLGGALEDIQETIFIYFLEIELFVSKLHRIDMSATKTALVGERALFD